MPIKEIVALAFAIVVVSGISNPVTVKQIKIRILRECVATNNWGNPSIFAMNIHRKR